ncbi:MAG: hypothetical protein NVS9B7_19560 [Flavisolibacter sp.]
MSAFIPYFGGLTSTKFTRTLHEPLPEKVWIYQPSLGAGFRIQNVKIDYAFTNLANQSNPLFTHVFSLQFDLVNNNKKKKK